MGSRSWNGICSLSMVRSSLKSPMASNRTCHGSSFGNNTTALPSRLTTTSSPPKRYCLGKRTAWLLPFMKSFAVSSDGSSLGYIDAEYIRRCLGHPSLFGFSMDLVMSCADTRPVPIARGLFDAAPQDQRFGGWRQCPTIAEPIRADARRMEPLIPRCLGDAARWKPARARS